MEYVDDIDCCSAGSGLHGSSAYGIVECNAICSHFTLPKPGVVAFSCKGVIHVVEQPSDPQCSGSGLFLLHSIAVLLLHACQLVRATFSISFDCPHGQLML